MSSRLTLIKGTREGLGSDDDSESSPSLFEVESDELFDRENLCGELEMELGMSGMFVS